VQLQYVTCRCSNDCIKCPNSRSSVQPLCGVLLQPCHHGDGLIGLEGIAESDNQVCWEVFCNPQPQACALQAHMP
jgi:hypothetical protein